MQSCAYLHDTEVCHWQRLTKYRENIHAKVTSATVEGAHNFGGGAQNPQSPADNGDDHNIKFIESMR